MLFVGKPWQDVPPLLVLGERQSNCLVLWAPLRSREDELAASQHVKDSLLGFRRVSIAESN
jgi:hypothetical protein